jgi:hypothetical protein
VFTSKKNIFIGLALLLLLVGGVGYAVWANTCLAIPEKEPEMGSQGFRIWSGPTLKSFEHGGRKICIPEGWQAVGEIQSGKDWAKYESGMTGVVIRQSAFASTTLEFQNSSYIVTVFYPGTERTPLTERYLAAIKNAFERTGAVFGDSKKEPKPRHTVLLTPGIEGTTSGNGVIAIYPDPSSTISIFVRSVDSIRGEELFIHAVTHLYNRFRKDLLVYQKNQSPIAAEDWQELEAVWAETAFRTSPQGRTQRLEYLYNVHIAVTTHDFTLITGEPFNNREAFDQIKPSVVLEKNFSYLDAQYGHYVLGALSMTAIDVLLQKYGTNTSVEKILLDLHTGKSKNFFTELEKILPSKEIENIKGWMFEGKPIPRELIFP